MSVPETRPAVSQDAPADDAHKPRPLNFAENVVLTVKVLGGLGLLGVALWAASLWSTAQ